MEIWINPACTKCAIALEAFDEAGSEYTIRYYLDEPPSRLELVEVVARLGLEPWEITRTSEPVAAELGMADWPRDSAHRDQWIDALAAHPILIQRPIITADDGTTIIARTDDALQSVLRD